MSKIIVTSALPYINGIPHLGNLAGSILPADIYSKYLSMAGRDHIFICGSDQHGTPVELTAIRLGIPPEEYADSMHERVKAALEAFGCTFTYYGKTHTDANMRTVYSIFDALRKNGYIIEAQVLQAYCLIDKRFIPDRMIEGVCPFCNGTHARGDQCDDCGHTLRADELIEPHCNICGKGEIEFRNTKSLMLDLPALSKQIMRFVEKRKELFTKNAINKTVSFVEGGLKPRSISREIRWGFKIPMEGYEDKVFYVWFDAVIGYIGITDEWSHAEADTYWKEGSTELIQFMGKDNIEFHTVIWPAILSGSDLGYILPKRIIAYEWLNSKSVKFSKSRGNGLNIENSLKVLGADYWRFMLAYLLPETSDSEFSPEAAEEIVNKIMNDKIGNFVHRAITIALRNIGMLGDTDSGQLLDGYSDRLDSISKSYVSEFESIRIREALREVVALADIGNELMSGKRPWELAKSGNSSEFSKVMLTALRISKNIGILLWPFANSSSASILKHFGIHSEPKLAMLQEPLNFDSSVPEEQVFYKIGEREISLLSEYKG
jgi:methionyl-tRNA synthetase